MKNIYETPKRFLTARNIGIWTLFYFVLYIILLFKFAEIKDIGSTALLFHIYSITVFVYIVSRFGIAYYYQIHYQVVKNRYQPTVTFAVPTLNEEKVIKDTILHIARSNYLKDKFNVIVVNDGSTDNTLKRMYEAKRIAKKQYGIKVEVINWEKNRGKRQGMAECVRRSKNDIVVFVDSDTLVGPDAIRHLVKHFKDPKIGAVAAHGYVANANKNFLTKMQDVRYFVAFKAYKSAEAFFGTVTCCSGCGSAYRRKYVMEFLNEWVNQTFLGVKGTYGDDRSMTNFVLKNGYFTVFEPQAIVHTHVPETFKQFMKQQLRWKKSWIKETLKASTFMWKRHPFMALSFYTSFILTVLSPLVFIRAVVWRPLFNSVSPIYYIIGLLLMVTAYGLYYYAHTKDHKWVYGVIFSIFYQIILIWQLPYALLKLRDGQWGTRKGVS